MNWFDRWCTRRVRGALCRAGWHRVHVETVTYMQLRRAWCPACHRLFLVAEGVE